MEWPVSDSVRCGETLDIAKPKIQKAAKGATVVKAFNLYEAQVWEMTPSIFDGRQLIVPFCTDTEEASSIEARLISDIGRTLTDARHLETVAASVISRLFDGANPYSVFHWIDPKLKPI